MDRPKLDPSGFHGKIPLAPHQLTDDLTRREDVIVLCHVGVPRIDVAQWDLTVDGMVKTPAQLNFADLQRFPRHTVTTIHQCAGSPLTPQEPKRRITNVRWSGARVTDVLAACGVDPRATFLWSSGADYGEFAGVAIDRYIKDLPLSRLASDVLIATELKGEPLSAEHGYPARLVVPGFYGTNSVKWLTAMTLADRRIEAPFTTRWYNDPVLDAQGRENGETRPVWAIAPESVIVSPAPQQDLKTGQGVTIWGRAWADAGVRSVEISTDGSETWQTARLEPRIERAWQRFSLPWKPERPGSYRLASRATGNDGASQPAASRRNAIHYVDVMAG